MQRRSFFWSVFSRIRTEYGEIRSISSYSVRIRENTDQKKLCICTLSLQCKLWYLRESRVGFSESLFKLLQNSVIFCAFYPGGYTAGASSPYSPRLRCHWLGDLPQKRLRMYLVSVKNWHLPADWFTLTKEILTGKLDYCVM